MIDAPVDTTPGVPRATDLTVVIPTYRAPELTLRAVTALAPVEPGSEVIVVDDASGDDTAQQLAASYPAATCVVLPQNKGFGGAVNAGFARARGRYLAALNNDAVATWDALNQLVAFLDENPDAAAVAPALHDSDGHRERVAFHFPSTLPAKVLRVLRRAPPERRGAAIRSDYLKGACVVFRRRALEEVGLFDEQYWMFAEEIDLFRRLAYAGWTHWFVAGAKVRHDPGSTTRNHPERELSSRYRQQSFRSMCRYWAKHHSLLDGAAQRVELALRVIGRAALECGRVLIGRGDRWMVAEHIRCLAVLMRRWPSRPREPILPRQGC